MSKKIKSPRRSISNNQEPWIKDLSNKVINNSAFNCSVSILIESRPFYRQLACEFDKYCQYGYRNCIKCISVDKITETIFTNCSKNGEVIPLAALCDEIFKYTGKYFKGKIPSDLYKYLIKYIILDYKERRLREKWVSAQNEMDIQNKLKPYLTKTATDKPNTKGVKTDGKKGNETKGTKNQPVLSDKLNTQLHKRSENLKCLQDIHDEPEGGPDLYIILIQNQNSDLPMELIDIDVPITNIIQMGYLETPSFDDDEIFGQILAENQVKNNEIDQILKLSHLSNNEYSKSFLTEDDIRAYWGKILYYMNRKQLSDDFHDVTILKYIPIIPDEPKSPDFIDRLRRSIYDGISKTVFDSYSLRKLHNEYIQNAKLLDVDSQTDQKLEELDHYLDVLNNIPQLSTPIELIIDTLINQVCIDLSLSDSDSEGNFLRIIESKISTRNATCLEKLIKNLGKSNQFQIYKNIQDNPAIDKDEDIRIHSFDDQLSRNMLNLNDKMIEFIKSRTLLVQKLFWDSITWSKIPCHNSLLAHYINIMNANFDDPLKREIVDLLICLIQLDKENDQEIRDQYSYIYDINPGDNYLEYINTIFMKINLDKNVDILTNNLSIFSPFLTDVNFQKMEELLRYSSHYKFEHIGINDKLLTTFSNKRMPLIKRKELPTVLSLREFVEDISKENRLETNRILYNKNKYNYSEMFEIKMNYLIKEDHSRSAKANELICGALKYQGDSEDWIISEYDTVYDHRNKYKFFLKDIKKTSETETQREGFQPILYNVGQLGKLEFYFFDMNIKINKEVQVFLRYWDIPSQEKYQLNFTAKVKTHEMHYNTNILPESFYQEPSDIRIANLHIEHESGMMFSINKVKGENNNNFHPDFPILNYLKFKNKMDNSDSNFFQDKKSYNFELNISWPNGLTIKQINIENLIYIKQKYICKKPDTTHYNLHEESYRCMLSTGSVIKFMEDNSVIILFGNGGIINCTRFSNGDYKFRNDSNAEKNIEEVQIENLKMLDYEFRKSDGKIFSAVDGILKEQKGLFVEDINNILKCSITTQFSDGIEYEHKSDCSLTITFLDGTHIISYARFAGSEIVDDIPEPTNTKQPNKQKKSKEKKQQEKEHQTKKYEIEPFTIVEISYKIDHPCFATVVFSYNGPTCVLTMPNKTQVALSDNIHINFKQEIQIFNYRTSLVVQEVHKEKVKNELLFSFENFRRRSEHEKLDPCIIVRDCEHNSILIYDNGKFEINDSTNDNINEDRQLYVIDRDFKGLNILSKYNMNKGISSMMKDSRNILRQTKKEHFINNLIMTPVLNIDKWSHFNDFINLETPTKYPSTYGKYWYFPFKDQLINTDKPKAILVRHFNEIINIKELLKEIKRKCFYLISLYKAEQTNIYDSAYTNTIQLFLHLENTLSNTEFTLNEYKRGSLKLENMCESRDSKNFIKKIVLNKTGQGIYQSNINHIKKQYEEDKLNIRSNKILPYFENGEGLAFLLLKEISEAHIKIEAQNLEKQELKELLYRPMREIKEKDLGRIKELAVKLNNFINMDDSPYTFDQILHAGKKLQNYFSNVEEVLQFHKMIQRGRQEECP